MSHDVTPIKEGLERYLQDHSGWGASADLARRAGVSGTLFSKILNGGQRYIELTSWVKLHKAQPNYFPPPPLVEINLSDHQLAAPDHPSVFDGPKRLVPIFDANCGEGVKWTDGGLPVGEGLETMELPLAWLNGNSFVLRVHNDSMAPTLIEGDLVLVNPHAQVEEGDVVFASLSDDGDKLIKRFRRSGEMVVLESDNKNHPPVVLNDVNGHEARVYKVVRLVDRKL